MSKTKKLTEEQFWRWSHHIEELNHAKTKIQVSQAQVILQDKSIECEGLKKRLYQAELTLKMQGYTTAESNYNQEKQKLEAELGLSLNNTVINTETREVKLLDDKPKKPSKDGA